MKRFLFWMLMLSPLYAYAQLSGSGYYRVQNKYTERYLSIVDTRASYEISGSNVIADLDALYMLKGFENKVAFNPATICYVQTVGTNSCNLEGQGLDFYEQTGLLLYYNQLSDGYYHLWGTKSGFNKFLADNSGEEDYGYERYFSPNLETGEDGRKWKIYPVTQDNDRYFGIKPDVKASANNLYWSTLYAGFPFKASAETTKLYTVSEIDYTAGYAIVEEITGIVPKQTPVLVLCSGSTPKENKLTLYAPSATGEVPDNHLVGNYYCNDVTGTHRNVMAYKPANMRMLGVTADGRPAFVKSNISYIPANKCYLPVYSSAPDELLIITADDYKKGSSGIEDVRVADKVNTQEIWYTLDGRRLQSKPTTKGLYIVNGKKVIVK